MALTLVKTKWIILLGGIGFTSIAFGLSPSCLDSKLSGSFVHPTAGVRKFSGVVSQKQRVGWGFFLGVDQGGSMLLQP